MLFMQMPTPFPPLLPLPLKTNGPSHLVLNKRSSPPRFISPPFLLILFIGNQGLRWFPYTGYLGLTPIRVDGGWLFFLHLYQ